MIATNNGTLTRRYRKPMNVGLVAKVCRVSKKTVLNWIYRTDGLKAFTTFGGHYRVWPGDLNDFLTKHRMDIQFSYIEERQTKILLLSALENQDLWKEIIFPQLDNANAEITATDNKDEALLLLGAKSPQLTVIDLDMPGGIKAEALGDFVRTVGRNEAVVTTTVIAITSQQLSDTAIHSLGVLPSKKLARIGNYATALKDLKKILV